MYKVILVTGGAGFIGSHLVEGLLNLKVCQHVIVVDNMSMGSIKNLTAVPADQLTVIQADAGDLEIMSNIFAKYDIDLVCHLATSPLVLSISDPLYVYENILNMQKTLLECQRRGFFKKLVSFSTSEVYGSSDGIKLNELSRLKPQTPYASAKAAADLLTESYASTFPSTIEYTILRPFNNYGPRKKVLESAGIIPQTISALSQGKSITLVNNGDTSRDFVNVLDTVNAVITIIKSPEKTKNELFIIASRKSRTMKSIVNDIAKLMNRTPSIIYGVDRPGDVSFLQGDDSKIRDTLKFEPKVPWEEGLARCIDFYS